MNAVEITIRNSQFVETVVASQINCSTFGTIRQSLEKLACQRYGKEGGDWRICQANDTRLIPLYARQLHEPFSEIHIQ